MKFKKNPVSKYKKLIDCRLSEQMRKTFAIIGTCPLFYLDGIQSFFFISYDAFSMTHFPMEWQTNKYLAGILSIQVCCAK